MVSNNHFCSSAAEQALAADRNQRASHRQLPPDVVVARPQKRSVRRLTSSNATKTTLRSNFGGDLVVGCGSSKLLDLAPHSNCSGSYRYPKDLFPVCPHDRLIV